MGFEHTSTLFQRVLALTRGQDWPSLIVQYTGGHWGACNLKFGRYRRCATSVTSRFEVAGTPVATRVDIIWRSRHKNELGMANILRSIIIINLRSHAPLCADRQELESSRKRLYRLGARVEEILSRSFRRFGVGVVNPSIMDASLQLV